MRERIEMNAYDSIYRFLYLKAYGWQLGEPLARILAATEYCQWKTRKELEEASWSNTRRVIHYAFDQVPYYHHLLKSIGLRPEDITSPTMFRRIPITSKDVLRAEYVGLHSKTLPQRFYENTSGGSTGIPVRVLQDSYYKANGVASQIRSQEAMGWKLGQRSAYIWGAERDSPRLSASGRVKMAMQRILWVNSFRMTESMIRESIHSLREQSPRIIIGYASSLHLVARFILKEGLDPPQVQGVQSSAETLFPTQREDIERAFRSRVFDKYGARDAGDISFECEAHVGMHINVDQQYVEFEREGEPVSPGEDGRILVTNLTNSAMPLLRYDVDDVSSPMRENCTCGRGLPLMNHVKGRVSDTIFAPNGRLVHGEYFTHLFYHANGVREFQVDQVSRNKLVIRIVKGSGFNDALYRHIEEEIHQFIDPALEIEFVGVDQIPLTRTGKHRFTISRVQIPI
jgi:phenylacetate-CoA ligase